MSKTLDKIEKRLPGGDAVTILLAIKKAEPEIDVLGGDTEHKDYDRLYEKKRKIETLKLERQYPEITKFLRQYKLDWFNMRWAQLAKLSGMNKKQKQRIADAFSTDLTKRIISWAPNLRGIKLSAKVK